MPIYNIDYTFHLTDEIIFLFEKIGNNNDKK